MLNREEHPIDYSVGIKGMCPYCSKSLMLLVTKGIGESELSTVTYYYCSGCDKMFEKGLSLTNELNMGVKARQLSDVQKEEMKQKYRERLEG